MKALSLGILALAVALVSACTAPPAPRETFYRIEATLPARHFDTPPLAGVLEVDRVETEGVLSERAIAYQSGVQALQRYRYDLWTETPSLMIQDLLARSLRQAGAATTVVTPDLRVPPDWIMRTKLQRFEQLPATGKVVARLQVAIISASDSKLLLQEDYTQEASTSGEGPKDAALGLTKAVTELLAQLSKDFGTIPAQSSRR